LKLTDIQNVIAKMSPLDGAKETMDTLRSQMQVVIISDTFEQFAGPLMAQLGYPTIFCNTLIIDEDDNIIDFQLRQKDQKKKVIQSLKNLNYQTIACGDSYNDITMLQEADYGILFQSPQNVIDEFPEFTTAKNYQEIKNPGPRPQGMTLVYMVIYNIVNCS
jgi:phosphoserine/homoserine phosphotransferase